jgi:hypothetical protein
VASLALAIPVVLVLAGISEHVQAHAEAPQIRPINVVRVTKVVRPVTVKKVVERAPVYGQPGFASPAPAQDPPAPVPPRTTEDPKPRTGRTVVGQTAPVERQSTPQAQVEPDADETAPPASGSGA